MSAYVTETHAAAGSDDLASWTFTVQRTGDPYGGYPDPADTPVDVLEALKDFAELGIARARS